MKYIDKEQILQINDILGSNRYWEICDEIFTDIENLINNISTFNPEELFIILHQLKGRTLVFGLKELGEAFRHTEFNMDGDIGQIITEARDKTYQEYLNIKMEINND